MVPPSTFCNGSDTCVLHVGYNFIDSKAYQTCADSNIIPQAVFKRYSETSPCRLTITKDNWQKEMCVMVRAVADGLKDKNKKLHASITISVETTVIISQTTYPTVEVRLLFTSLFILPPLTRHQGLLGCICHYMHMSHICLHLIASSPDRNHLTFIYKARNHKRKAKFDF